MRRLLPLLAAAALAAVLVIGLSQAGDDATAPEAGSTFDLAEAQRSLAGAPPPLAALHAQGNRLLDGGVAAFEKRLSELEGHPVVVNKWASWCGPCRIEFPAFQQVSTRLGKEVAFLGLNAGDNRGDAGDFLARYPIPFPSYVDPDEKIAREIGAPANYPITVFFDAAGKRAFVHQGQYTSAADLEADIRKYAGA